MKNKENLKEEISDSSSDESSNDQNDSMSRNIQKRTKRRFKKSKYQLTILQQNFSLDKNWTREKIKTISIQANLSQEKVYKWFWDQKRKQSEQTENPKLVCDLIVKNGKIELPKNVYYFSSISTETQNEEDTLNIMEMMQHLIVLERQ